MSVIRGFFFDLDGTLVDTYQADFLAYRDAILAVTGTEITADEFAKTHGHEMKQKLKMLKLDVSEPDAQRIGEHKKQNYPKYVGQTKQIDAMIGFLRHVAPGSITVLVTSGKAQNAQLVLETHGLHGLFTHMVFGDDVEYPKPHPQPYQVALQKSGLKADEVLVFEDSETGVAAAQAAGLTVIHIPVQTPESAA